MLGLLVGLLMAGLGLGTASASTSTDDSAAEVNAPSAQDPTDPASTQSADTSRAPAGQTVVFGIPGLTIDDIDPEHTPNLYRLLSEGAAANLNVRTIG